MSRASSTMDWEHRVADQLVTALVHGGEAHGAAELACLAVAGRRGGREDARTSPVDIETNLADTVASMQLSKAPRRHPVW